MKEIYIYLEYAIKINIRPDQNCPKVHIMIWLEKALISTYLNCYMYKISFFPFDFLFFIDGHRIINRRDTIKSRDTIDVNSSKTLVTAVVAKKTGT